MTDDRASKGPPYLGDPQPWISIPPLPKQKTTLLKQIGRKPLASDSVSVPGGVGTAPVEVDLGVSGKKKGDDSVVTDSVPVPNSTVLAPLVSAVSEVSEISVADSSVPIDQCAHMDFTPVLSADLVADLPVSDPKTVAADIIKEAVIDCSTIIINSDVGLLLSTYLSIRELVMAFMNLMGFSVCSAT
ncbi:hypothetical protein ACOSQ3_023726 [Xanthoceras sorbifolium]